MKLLTFDEFSLANRTRCEAADGFGRDVGQGTVIAFALGVAEEAGEVAGKVRTQLGITKRKTVTVEEIGDEIADAYQYLDLLAQAYGLRMQDVLIRKFDAVSERVGYSVRLASPTSEEGSAGTLPNQHLPAERRGQVTDRMLWDLVESCPACRPLSNRTMERGGAIEFCVEHEAMANDITIHGVSPPPPSLAGQAYLVASGIVDGLIDRVPALLRSAGQVQEGKVPETPSPPPQPTPEPCGTKCETCGGDGLAWSGGHPQSPPCVDCKGTGKKARFYDKGINRIVECPTCNGTGHSGGRQ